MILFAAGSQAPAWEPSREAPASRVHVISHAFESSWEMTRSWSFVVSVPKLELGNQRTCVIVTLIHDEPIIFSPWTKEKSVIVIKLVFRF
jgi:hypothetical protein